MAEFTLTLYQDDHETPLFEVGTAPTHAHPYLQVPDAFGEAEIDLQQGRALIGQINVGIIDPQSGATQSDRWLTNLLANADGYTALNGRRALFAQVDPAVVVQDGVCFGVSLADDFSSFGLQLRDIRERGRKISVFNRSGTATVLPRGVVDGYGKLPTGAFDPVRWLALPTVPLTGTYDGDSNGGLILLDDAPSKPDDEVSPGLVVTQAMQDAMRMTGSPLVFDQVEVWWRASGASAWVEGQKLKEIRAPKGETVLTPQGYTQYGELVRTVRGKVKNADGTTTEVLGAKAIVVDSASGGTLPVDGQAVEVVIVYTGPASESYPLHFEGTWGTFTRNLLRGDYCGKDDTGEVVDPRIRYDETAILAIDTPVRIRISEPRDDLRKVLEELSAGIGGAPALNDAGEISPIVYHLPDVDAELPEINDSNAEAIPGWEHPADTAITVVEVVYPRDFAVSAADDPNGERSAGDGLSSRDVTLRRAPADLVSTLGEQTLKLDFWMFRALGGTDGQPINGDTSDESAAEIAVERQHQAIDRFAYGGVSSMVRLTASAFPGLAAGDWVVDARSWRPNYQTKKRGGNALAQVVSLRRLNPAWYEARLIDAGPADQPLDQPTLGTVTIAADGVVSVPVTAVPSGGEARVDYAISATLPATDSPLWRFLGRTDTAGTLKSQPLPADVTVWIRARSEGIARRRSAWTNAVSTTTPSTSRVLTASLKLAEDGTPVAAWTVNPSALGMRLYYAVHDPAATPTLAVYLDASAAAGTAAIPVTVAPGQAVTVEFEPYPGWTGTAVSGTPGTRVRRVAVRLAALQAPIVEYASDATGTNASSTFDSAIHTFWRWSTDSGATWTDWVRFVGENGASAEGRYTDFIFKTAINTPPTPTGDAPTGWFDAPPTYDPAITKLWMSRAERDGADDSLLSTWSTPVQITGAKGDTGAPGQDGDDGIDGAPGQDAIMAALSNDAHTIPTASDGSGGVFTGAVTTMSVYLGGTDDSASWSFAASPSAGVTGSLSGQTYTVTAMSTDSGYVDLVASRTGYPSISRRFTLSKSKTGSAGDPATAYWLVTDVAAIKRDLDGDYTPAALSISSKSATGTNAPAAYNGRYIIAETTDGTTYTNKYTSASNQSSKSYTPSAGIKAVRIRLYLAGGTSTLLDEEVVPVVEDGPVGTTGPAGSSDPKASLLRTGPHAAPPGDNLELSGELGTGGTGPLQWQWIAVVGGATSAVDWPATWQTSALPATLFAFADPKQPTTAYARVRDAAGRVSEPATWIVPPLLEAIDSTSGRVNPSVPFHGLLRTPIDTDTDAQAGAAADSDLGALDSGGYINRTSGKVLGVARSSSLLTGSDLVAEDDNLTRLTGRTLDNIADTVTYRRPGAGYVDSSGRVSGVWSGTTKYDGPTIGSGVSRAQTGLNSSGRVVTGVEASADLGGTAVGTVRDQALSPSQNLLGADAGPEQSAGYVYLNSVSLDTLNLAVGDVVSLRAEAIADGGVSHRVRVEFRNSVGTVIQGYDAAPQVSSAAWTAQSIAAMTIPATTATIRVLHTYATGAGRTRRVMLNRGPVPLAHEAAPFRPGRETADDVPDGGAKRVTTYDEAGQAAEPSQNLLGPDAGPQQSGSHNYLNWVTLDSLALIPGDVISLRAEAFANSGGSNHRMRIEFRDSGGTVLQTLDASPQVSAAAWTAQTIKAATIPAGAVDIKVSHAFSSGSGLTRRVMLNRGIVALPYQAPPFRPERETADDVGAGTNTRVTTHSEADGGGKADGALTEGGHLASGVRQDDGGGTIRVLAKGHVAGVGFKDGDHVTYPDPFQGVPLTILRDRGLLIPPASADWDPTYDSTAGVWNDLRPINETASGFDIWAKLVQRGAQTLRSHTFAVGTITSVGSSLARNLDNAPASDSAYVVTFDVEVTDIDLVSPHNHQVTIAVDTNANDGTGWIERATMTLISSTGNQTWSGRTLSAVVSGLDSTDDIRVRLKAFVKDPAATTAGCSIDPSTVSYHTSADNVTSKTPEVVAGVKVGDIDFDALEVS